MNADFMEYVRCARTNIIAYPRLVITAALKWFFMQDRRFEYSRDPEVSRIKIQEDGTIPESIGSRPYIVIQRGPISFLNVSMDQRLDLKFGPSDYAADGSNIDTETHLDLVQCGITLTCIAEQRLDAEYIAHTAMACAHFFRKILCHQFHLHDITVETINPNQVLLGNDAATVEGEVVPLACRIIWPYGWSITPTDGVVLRKLFIDLYDQETLIHSTDP